MCGCLQENLQVLIFFSFLQKKIHGNVTVGKEGRKEDLNSTEDCPSTDNKTVTWADIVIGKREVKTE